MDMFDHILSSRNKMKPIFKVSLYFLIVLVLSIVGPMFVTPVLYKIGLVPPLVLMVIHIIFFIVPAIIYIIVTKSNYKKVFSFKKPKGKDVFFSILIAALALPIMTFFSYTSSLFYTNDVALVLDQMRVYPLWLMILVVGVTPAITEEITIRGIALSGFEFKSKNVAAIMTGIMFGILHLNAHQFLYATAMGIILAYVVRATGSIFLSMLIHFLINSWNLIQQRIVSQGITTEDLVHSMDSIKNISMELKIGVFFYYLIFAIVAAFLISYLIRKMEKRNFDITLDELDVATRVSYKEERVINVPFIISVIVFIVYTFFIMKG
ncbi:type II CAAX endopeptidase family protein [Clostridium perfringens]|nr:type II CAAX endopeptidase family protein [Clostridium perfringens]MDK0630501.1 type II CAAX endopeptidase family protein [Clostridium perfringens]MDK0905341.1 type II CAAX endopeptidase family protein [Clostridium perfringens]MDK0911027.1 type II CAAX endopeptidase family protein [Clostridium perfringens]MDM0938438.1 type II CAAX endopeptidase family protein [Clostridium perfringens]MDM0957886.1 type II CAAX endopeptidase family protein [Clostridium perfringens]